MGCGDFRFAYILIGQCSFGRNFLLHAEGSDFCKFKSFPLFSLDSISTRIRASTTPSLLTEKVQQWCPSTVDSSEVPGRPDGITE